MAQINSNYLKLPGSYLFAAVAKKVAAFREAHPEADIIRLGIGDVTRPLVPAVVEAMHRAVGEMASCETFRGYGPEQGYDFLIDAVIRAEYGSRGVGLDRDEVFVSDGSKCDVANIQEIFDSGQPGCDRRPGLPGLPRYECHGRAYRRGRPGRAFRRRDLPGRDGGERLRSRVAGAPVDLIYLCSPNNPTGTVLSCEELAKWVAYARETGAVILFDSAYSAYIREPGLPGSIYEIPGAKEVAVEFKSFSKTAGFTGVRCAFTVVPKALKARAADGTLRSLNALWNRRQCTKFNGVSYVVQRGAEAVYSEAGLPQIRQQIDYYMENARIIREGLSGAGYTVFGGKMRRISGGSCRTGLTPCVFLIHYWNGAGWSELPVSASAPAERGISG